MPLGAEGVQSLGAIPSSPLEQISTPSALFCLWRSQPGAFVPSGKAVLRMCPIGCQAPRGSREGCTLSALLQKAPTAAAQGLSFSPLPCPQPVPLDEALPKVAADSQGQVQALLWSLQEGTGRGWSREGTDLPRTTHSPKGPTNSTKPLGLSSRGRRCGAAVGSLTWKLLRGISLSPARVKYPPAKHCWTIPGLAPAGDQRSCKI